MAGLRYDCLPVITVSAKDKEAASFIITEIIDNEVTDVYKEDETSSGADRVWRIDNKYYTADVRLRPVTDGGQPAGDSLSAEAHVVYLTEDETTRPAEVVRRRCGAAPHAHTRLVVAALPTDRLRAAADSARAELVTLVAGEDDDDEDKEDRGVGRVRAALHAHAWPSAGVRRHARTVAEDVERVEAFAAALAALPAAAQHARGDVAADRELRLERAEALVTAFCEALGDDVDSC